MAVLGIKSYELILQEKKLKNYLLISMGQFFFFSFYFATAGTVCKIVLFFFSFFNFVSLFPRLD